MKKNSCTPVNPKKYSCYGLKKIHTRNLITKKIPAARKFPSPPPHNFSNGPFLSWQHIDVLSTTVPAPDTMICRRQFPTNFGIELFIQRTVLIKKYTYRWAIFYMIVSVDLSHGIMAFGRLEMFNLMMLMSCFIASHFKDPLSSFPVQILHFKNSLSNAEKSCTFVMWRWSSLTKKSFF